MERLVAKNARAGATSGSKVLGWRLPGFGTAAADRGQLVVERTQALNQVCEIGCDHTNGYFKDEKQGSRLLVRRATDTPRLHFPVKVVMEGLKHASGG